MKNLGLKILVGFVLLIPLWSFLAWFLWPSDRLEAIILDKSATRDSKEEHRSFNWILTHEKMYRPSGKDYDYSRDYYGTYPEGIEGLVHELDDFKVSEMDSMSFYIDMAYFADAQGVEMNVDSIATGDKWYGGLSQKDYELLKVLYRDHKLIMAEYNTIAAPTREPIRAKMENLFEVDFTGWVGRAFASLDTSEAEDIPLWLRQQYRKYYRKPFDFDDIPGIVLAHESGRVVVLENKKHLEASMPVINTELDHQRKLGVSNLVNYPNWFDITLSRRPENICSYYKIHTNEEGDSLMAYYNIPRRFPAVIGDKQENLRYYFCGDFADNDIMQSTAYFKGVELISNLFYLTDKAARQKKFFWEYYRPLITRIINQYLSRLKVDEKARALPVDSGYQKYRILDTGMVLLPESGARLYDTEELLNAEPEPLNETNDEMSEPVQTERWDQAFSRHRFRVGGRLSITEWKKRKKGPLGNTTPTPAEVSSTAEVIREKEKTIAEPARTPVNVKTVDPSDKKWRIIIASLQSPERAQRYVDQLGYPELSIVYVDHLNTNRVAYGEYSNLRDAQIQFERVVQDHPDAWMVLF
ncbi:MAG: SPOR domain-containing protein [Owenweeksia sp.]